MNDDDFSYETPPLSRDEKESRLWGMLCHLASLLGWVGIPFGSILGPLVVWLVKRNDYPFVDEQGKESLNFQITVMIAGLISGILVLVVIGIFLLMGLVVYSAVLAIVAGIKANQGESFRYPLTIRLIK